MKVYLVICEMEVDFNIRVFSTREAVHRSHCALLAKLATLPPPHPPRKHG